jgi:hypothetical protein
VTRRETFRGLLAPLLLAFIAGPTLEGFRQMNPGPPGPGRGADPHPGDRDRGDVDAAKEAVAAGPAAAGGGGTAALTMRRLAERLGIRAPRSTSTSPTRPPGGGHHRHRPGGGGGAFEAAVDGADEPLPALAAAYRGFALARPHLYRLMNNGPLPRQHLPPGLEDRTAAPVLRVAGSHARALWAFAHGMVMLELDHRFPPEPTWTAPGRPASPPSSRPDRRLGMVRPVARGSDGRDGGAR